MEDAKYSILYVDDEHNNLKIFKNTFRREYNVFTAISAKEGINILKNKKINTILSDQRMPEMTGVDFLKYTLKTHPDINRILITGYTDFNVIKSAINEAKIYQYIQKPWRENDLSSTIKEALKIYELEKENKKLPENLKIANINFANTNIELIEAAKKISIEKTKAVESNRLKSVFLSNLSHEIRTPMNGIIGFANLLQTKNLSSEKNKKYTDIIIDSSEQLLKIIDDIIEISRFETNQIEFNIEKINISSFFNDIYFYYKAKTDDKNISFVFNNKISDDKSIFKTDEAKLTRITKNLLDNAIKFTDNGYVKITCKIINEVLIVEIIDTGIGISEKMQPKIFESFRQEDENHTRLYDGLGLGLAIVKENIKILGGKIQVVSKKGKGSIFRFKIPVKK